MKNSLQSYYRSLLTETDRSISSLKKSINIYSFFRLLIFIICIAGLFFTIKYSAWFSIGFIIIMLALFLNLVIKHSKLQQLLTHQLHCATLLQNEINVLNGQQNIYYNGASFIDGTHPYTSDLDIFGENSLFAYLNRAITNEGKQLIAKWLQNPEKGNVIASKADALLELNTYQIENLNFRAFMFSLKADILSTLKINIETHLSSITDFAKAKKINYLVTILPISTFTLLGAAIIFNGVLWPIFSLQLVVNFTVYNFLVKRINSVHHLISRTNDTLKKVAHIIESIENTSWQTPYIQQIVAPLKNPSGNKTYKQIFKLAKIVTQLDYRNNLLVGIFLNIFFCWDLKIIIRLLKWQQTSSTSLIKSLNLISHFEALHSLATLNYNHPQWARPQIESSFSFEANEMAHPLIAPDKKVVNNFHFELASCVDIITGSNMAGKSTFLRTLGINLVLAYAGANVCATHFKTSVFRMVSYMRIIDSLDADTSTFKAEINRLKLILHLTKTYPNTLVLIDEMLRGTNSKDKYLGSKALVEKLISQHTPTLFATHDLQIAELQNQYPNEVRNFNFDVKIEGDKMFFDYKIKTGECKTFNAAVLLKAIGLE